MSASSEEDYEDENDFEEDDMQWDITFTSQCEAHSTTHHDRDESPERIRACNFDDITEHIKACSLSPDIELPNPFDDVLDPTQESFEEIKISTATIRPDEVKNIFWGDESDSDDLSAVAATSFSMKGYKKEGKKKLQRQVVVNCYDNVSLYDDDDDDSVDETSGTKKTARPLQFDAMSIFMTDQRGKRMRKDKTNTENEENNKKNTSGVLTETDVKKVEFDKSQTPAKKPKGGPNERYGLTFTHQNSTFDRAVKEDDATRYCLSLLRCEFQGQVNKGKVRDHVDDQVDGLFHLGSGLQMMDAYLREHNPTDENLGNDDYYVKLLNKVAIERKGRNETEAECIERFKDDNVRFLEIYKERSNSLTKNPAYAQWGGHSQPLRKHYKYWGTWQQLLSGKVISDWVDRKNGPIDPVFGVLLHPTTGRAGKGDSCKFHHFIYDQNGKFAYHSAVHDAFGYLIDIHKVGPGYNYINRSLFDNSYCLAGQVFGVKFWRDALKKLKLHSDLDLFSNAIGSTVLGKNKEITVY